MADNNYSKLPLHLDYDELKRRGIEMIQQMSGKVWTDYNEHDPGVTMLEQLCFALVDLGYRTSFDMKDLLMPKSGHMEDNDTIVSPERALQCNPVTFEDLRKLILEDDRFDFVRDIEFVEATRELQFVNKDIETDKDSQFEPETDKTVSVKGFYKVFVELMPDRTGDTEELIRFIDRHRNIGERMFSLQKLDFYDIGIKARIEMSSYAQADKVIDLVMNGIHDFVHPRIMRHSAEELLARGYGIDEIYHGQTSANGMIDRNELRHHRKITELHKSDIINIMMGIDGVESVEDFSFISRIKEMKDSCVTLQDIGGQAGSESGAFRFRPSFCSFEVVVNGLSFKIRSCKDYSYRQEGAADLSSKLPLPEGRYHDTGAYHSVQHELPKCYNLGPEGVSRQADIRTKASSHQLKGYLTLFEQMLADYLEKLSSISDVLSWHPKEDGSSFFRHKLTDDEVKDISSIIKEYDSYKGYTDPVLEKNAKEERNAVLNHLMARMGEKFVSYFVSSYAADTYEYDINHEIESKQSFLQHYIEESGSRMKGEVLPAMYPVDERMVASGPQIEKRILRKLDIPVSRLEEKMAEGDVVFEDGTRTNANNRIETKDYRENFFLHVVDHSMLIPSFNEPSVSDYFLYQPYDEGGEYIKDPYSLRATVLVPGWFTFANASEEESEIATARFRQVVEKVISEEMPLHISYKVLWLDSDMMLKFERAYGRYMKSMDRWYGGKVGINNRDSDEYKELIRIIVSLQSVKRSAGRRPCEIPPTSFPSSFPTSFRSSFRPLPRTISAGIPRRDIYGFTAIQAVTMMAGGWLLFKDNKKQ